MRTLNPDSGPRGKGRIYPGDRLSRILNAECLRLELQSPVGRSGLLSVDGERQSPAACSRLHIDRSIIGIGNLDIFISSCDSRVVGRRHIAYDHGMVLSLGDLQLRKQCGIIQGGGDLAHSAAYAVHHLAVLISRRRGIAVSPGKWLHTFVTGQSLPGHQHTAVDLRGTYLKISGPGLAAGTEIGGKSAQHILYLGQHLRGLHRLRHNHRRFHGHRLSKTGLQGCVQCRCGLLQIHGNTGLGRSHDKLAVLPDDGGILSFPDKGSTLFFHKSGHRIPVDLQFQFYVNRISAQILLFHIAFNNIACMIFFYRLFHHIGIVPAKSQILRRGFHQGSVHIQAHGLGGQAGHIILDLLLRFLCLQTSQLLSSHRKPFRYDCTVNRRHRPHKAEHQGA